MKTRSGDENSNFRHFPPQSNNLNLHNTFTNSRVSGAKHHSSHVTNHMTAICPKAGFLLTSTETEDCYGCRFELLSRTETGFLVSGFAGFSSSDGLGSEQSNIESAFMCPGPPNLALFGRKDSDALACASDLRFYAKHFLIRPNLTSTTLSAFPEHQCYSDTIW